MSIRELLQRKGGTVVSLGDAVKHRLEDLDLEANVLPDVYIAAY